MLNFCPFWILPFEIYERNYIYIYFFFYELFRLEACRNLALLLQILDCSELRKDFLSETLNLCRAYFVLSWCCETVMQDHPQLISLMQSILSLPQIVMQSLLLDSVWSILQFLYPFIYFKLKFCSLKSNFSRDYNDPYLNFEDGRLQIVLI